MVRELAAISVALAASVVVSAYIASLNLVGNIQQLYWVLGAVFLAGSLPVPIYMGIMPGRLLVLVVVAALIGWFIPLAVGISPF